MEKVLDTTKRKSRAAIATIWRFYADGFRGMTLGRTLWALILIKLAVIFLVFKMWFFPDILQRDYADDSERAQAVRTSLIKPPINP